MWRTRGVHIQGSEGEEMRGGGGVCVEEAILVAAFMCPPQLPLRGGEEVGGGSPQEPQPETDGDGAG